MAAHVCPVFRTIFFFFNLFMYDDITNFFPDRVSSACLSNQQSIVAYMVWILETVLLTD